MILDHIAISAETLEAGVAWAEERLGVPMGPGGTHHGYGTHNRLLAAGDIYIEVIAPDPAQGAPKWFNPFHGPPRLAHWLCRVEELHSAYPIHSLARGELDWRITVPEGGILPGGGAEPSLLEWGQGGHPLDKLTPTALRLKALRVWSPEPLELRMEDARVSFAIGPPRLEADIETPAGLRRL